MTTEKTFIQQLANCYKANTLTWDNIEGLVLARYDTEEKSKKILAKVKEKIERG